MSGYTFLWNLGIYVLADWWDVFVLHVLYCLNEGSFEFSKLRTKSLVARRQESKRLGVAVDSIFSKFFITDS